MNSLTDPALVNTRRKEKKSILQRGLKPSVLSEWVQLSEHMLAWFKTNQSRNINDYAITHGYPPYKFKKWIHERDTPDVFRESFEMCVFIVADRREKYLDEKDKLYLLYLKQMPLYDWDYRDYENEKSSQDGSIFTQTTPIIFQQIIEKTPEGDAWVERKNKAMLNKVSS